MNDKMKFTWFMNRESRELENFIQSLNSDEQELFLKFKDISNLNKTIQGDGGDGGAKGVEYKVIKLDTKNNGFYGRDEYRIWVELQNPNEEQKRGGGGRRKRRKSKRKKSRKSRKRSKTRRRR